MANKSDLINEVVSLTGEKKKNVLPIVEAVFLSIQKKLSQGEKVQLLGFGTFAVRERAAHKGRNPQTGEEIQISARKVPVFKAGKLLKDVVK